jgi:hypothetical protein
MVGRRGRQGKVELERGGGREKECLVGPDRYDPILFDRLQVRLPIVNHRISLTKVTNRINQPLFKLAKKPVRCIRFIFIKYLFKFY